MYAATQISTDLFEPIPVPEVYELSIPRFPAVIIDDTPIELE